MPRQLLLNPYGTKTADLVRIQTWVSPEDRERLKSVATITGFESFAVALYYQSLANLVTSLHLTYADRPALQSFIESLPAFIQTAGEGYFSHVQRGANSPHQHPSSDTNKPANDVQIPPSGSGRGRGRNVGPGAKSPIIEVGKPTQTRSGT